MTRYQPESCHVMFELDPELDRISVLVDQLPVSQLRLMHDGRVFWVMLIPRVKNATEWHHLGADQMAAHGEEIRVVSKALELADGPAVINVGMFGHGVKQLHVHLAARHEDDPLWPKIAFMTGPAEPRSADGETAALTALRAAVEQAVTELGSDLLQREVLA